MWKKILIIIILFYLFALLQNSFFTHFSFFGSIPNLIFILFFLLAFFEKKNNIYQVYFLAVIAGLLSDIFSYRYLGVSVVLLLIVGFLLKKTQFLLKNREDSHPFVYFLPLFLAYFVIYEVVLMIFMRFADPAHALINLDLRFLAGIIYNLLFASIFFYIYKKCRKFIK